MSEKLQHKAVKTEVEDIVQKIINIFDTEDGRSFEDKKKEALEYLQKQEDTLLAERIVLAAVNDETGRYWKTRFWEAGEVLPGTGNIVLRKVTENDREMFLALQKETSPMKSMFCREEFCLMLWKEHIQDKALMVTIVAEGEYAGYCGINNLSRKQWEIAIELRKKWRRQGIGYAALHIFLSELKARLQRNTFRIKIDPENYASQQLFEKLGAVPYGIAEFILHKEEDILRCEEENLQEIDDQLIELASRFKVEPRKLLSHVLEYELKW